MSEQTIAEKVKNIIVDRLNVKHEELKPEANFMNDLGADSLDRVELVLELEKQFQISIADEEAEKFDTVGKVIAYLQGVEQAIAQ